MRYERLVFESIKNFKDGLKSKVCRNIKFMGSMAQCYEDIFFSIFYKVNVIPIKVSAGFTWKWISGFKYV